MSLATIDARPTTVTPPKVRLRFAFREAAGRIGLAAFVVKELIFAARVTRFPAVPWPRKVGYVLSKIPESLVISALIALAAATVLELLVRVLTQPRMVAWLSPNGSHSFAIPYAFRLAASERVEAEWPARRAEGNAWSPGTLVLTDRALRFFPHAWDAEPWSCPRDEAETLLRPVPSPPMSWGFVSGLPDRLALVDRRRRECFALLDPDRVLETIGHSGWELRA